MVNCSNVNRMTNRMKNVVKSVIESETNTIFKSSSLAEAFITRNYPTFLQESAGNRSSQGWHWDYSFSQGAHINIYGWSRSGKYFRTHIFWTDD